MARNSDKQSRNAAREKMRYDSEYEGPVQCPCVRCAADGSKVQGPAIGSVVEFVAGPFKGQTGYVDDETSVDLEEDAEDYIAKVMEVDGDDSLDDAPWAVGPAWAIVYRRSTEDDYDLVPWQHLHLVDDPQKRQAFITAMTGTADAEG